MQTELPDFKLEEFACKCNKPICLTPDMSVLHQRIQVLRTIVGHPLRINSAYRCTEHNIRIGGAKSSKHLEGLALDIDTIGWTGEQRSNFIRQAAAIGFNGIGIAKTYIHIDLREIPTLWQYPRGGH